MFCRNCGKEIGSDAKFCPECGAAQNDYAYQSDSSKDIKKENPNGNTESSDSKAGLASMILGIVSLVLTFGIGITGYGWVGSICGILAIVFGVMGKKNPEQKGMATAGIICGFFSLFSGILSTIACLSCLGVVGSAVDFSRLNDLMGI